ncbi:MAG: AAA family ATPase [Sulfuricaulis sp.]
MRSAVLYGPNAGGKSNLVNAAAFMRAVVADSATTMQLGQLFNVQPFRLNPDTVKEPSKFELTFLEGGVRYQYGFALTTERVIEEWLLAYRTAKPQQWFARHYDKELNQDIFEFGSHLTGQRKLWQESTRTNALFLSTAVQLNSEQLRPIFTWIVHKLVVLGAGMLPIDFSVAMLQQDEGKQGIQEFMNSADISIADINVVPRKGMMQTFKLDAATGKPDVRTEERDILMPQFRHETKQGSAIFEFADESLGTQRLFALAGPVLDILKTGRILIVDELDSSLHPLLVRRLVGLFHNPKINTANAQLIFTTHDTTLFDPNLLRRDQIWFVEKNHEQATTLYPFTDFSPRKKEAWERGYLMGRYGALPFFRDLAS